MKTDLKRNDSYRLKKKGSSKSSFYLHEELPADLERVLKSSLAIKGIKFVPIQKTITKSK